MVFRKYLKYIVFFFVLILLDIWTGKQLSNLSKKQKRDTRIEQLLDGKIKSDILILGSSIALNDYSPEIIKKNTGFTCYNLGISGSNPLFHETILDLILLNSHKPKIIIYNIDDYAALYTKDGVVYRTDMLYPYAENDFVNKKINIELKRSQLATLVSNCYRQNINFINSVKYILKGQEKIDHRINNINEFGACLINKKTVTSEVLHIKEKINLNKLTINELYKQALSNIQIKCLKNNIKILFSFPPQYSKPTKGFYNMVTSFKEKNTQIVNLSESLNSPRYFFDEEHLNIDGATYFSKLLSDELQNINFLNGF